MADLRVELYGHLIGHLVGNDWRTFYFEADPQAFGHFDIASTVLSERVPLLPVRDRSNADAQRTFFSELLPEGRVLTELARRSRTAEGDVIALLAHYGRDVAGALQIWDPDRPGEPRHPHTTVISNDQLEVLLSDTSMAPLGNSPLSGKTSLAGVQEKILLARTGNEWHQVHDGYPSTHILKPEHRDLPTMIFDEEYGCRLARLLGLARHETAIQDFGSISALVVERYDRSNKPATGRIHQEDMNQALGARGNEKYQERVGKVSLARIARIFTKHFDENSLTKLAQMNALSVAIGNLDMHAKNISILHYPEGTMAIAPMYDIVPMRHLNNDGRMALATNGVYEHHRITAHDIVTEAQSWGLANSDAIVRATLDQILELVRDEEPHPRAHRQLAKDIAGFCRNLLAGKPAGSAEQS